MSPKFRYFLYVWSTNVSQGTSGPRCLPPGNLTWPYLQRLPLLLASVIFLQLPGVRSTEGNFPYWLGVDERLIADEFFRPSYTTGIFARGKIVHGLDYQIMLGNNLSQLGIDAGQADNGLNTISTSLVWMPTTGEFGAPSSFGDFEDHQKFATRVGGHFTRGDENRQSQPATTDNFDNVQIRLSDGSVVFQPGLFGPGINVTDVIYSMADVDAGFKYHGYALEGEFYRRWLGNFQGPGTAGLATVNDHGFQLQASAMLRPENLQLYASGSKVYGNYGNPWDARFGINWYPWKNQNFRWNFEYIQLHKSPVGGLSLPYPVGGNGPVFFSNFEVNF